MVLTAVLLTAVVFVHTGCSLGEAYLNARQQNVGEKWINSEIEGAIDDSVTVRLQDDFYTAVNKDWILEQKLGDEDFKIELFNPMELVEERKLELLKKESTGKDSTALPDPEAVGMTQEEYLHARDLVDVFAEAAGDIDGRNRLGAEPLRPYLEYIRNIGSLEEMTSFLLDGDAMNLVGAPFISLTAVPLIDSPETVSLCASPIDKAHLALQDVSQYTGIDSGGIRNKEAYSGIVETVLGKLGYSGAQIRRILRLGYDFEYLLAKECKNKETYYNYKDYSENHEVMDTAGLTALTGDYPLREILARYGLDGIDQITVEDPAYMKAVGRLYHRKNLERMKAYFIIHTVYACADLLDIPTKEAVYEALEIQSTAAEENAAPEDPIGGSSAPEQETQLSESEKALKTVLKDYVSQYLRAPLEMLYIASYCRPEQKKAISDMAADIKEQMHGILSGEEWLCEESKKNAVRKLEMMETLVLYPDSYISYQDLKLDAGMSLPQMAHNILEYNRRLSLKNAGKPNDRTEWDLALVPTTDDNAYYNPECNAIAILAGITANDFIFSYANEPEVNMARLGTVVGHEITHGFDSMGYGYNEYGFKYYPDREERLITFDEQSEFTKRVFDLTMWYAALSPVPGAGGYTANVSGESIADMGGMKAVLRMAAGMPDFDYDLFFRSYAQMWRKVNTFEMEKAYATMDEHPLAFLRVNVTVSQFDEFVKTYGIGEEDGMYTAPENRIPVW